MSSSDIALRVRESYQVNGQFELAGRCPSVSLSNFSAIYECLAFGMGGASIGGDSSE